MPGSRKTRKATRQRARKNRNWRPAFLAAFAATGIELDACDAVPVSKSVVWRERKSNPEFAAAFEEARQTGALTLVKEATRRAVQGVQRLKFYEGQVIMVPTGKMIERDGQEEPEMIPYVEHEYSDQLLVTLLKRHYPTEYRENSKVEHSGGVKIVRLPAEETEDP